MKQILLVVVFVCLYGSFFTEEALLSADSTTSETSLRDSLALSPLASSSSIVKQKNKELGLWQYD